MPITVLAVTEYESLTYALSLGSPKPKLKARVRALTSHLGAMFKLR